MIHLYVINSYDFCFLSFILTSTSILCCVLPTFLLFGLSSSLWRILCPLKLVAICLIEIHFCFIYIYFFNFPFPYKMCEEKCVVCKIIYGWGAWWNTWQSSSYSERGSWLVYIPFELLKVWTCFGVQMLKAKPLGLSVQSGHYLQYTGLGCHFVGSQLCWCHFNFF